MKEGSYKGQKVFDAEVGISNPRKSNFSETIPQNSRNTQLALPDMHKRRLGSEGSSTIDRDGRDDGRGFGSEYGGRAIDRDGRDDRRGFGSEYGGRNIVRDAREDLCRNEQQVPTSTLSFKRTASTRPW